MATVPMPLINRITVERQEEFTHRLREKKVNSVRSGKSFFLNPTRVQWNIQWVDMDAEEYLIVKDILDACKLAGRLQWTICDTLEVKLFRLVKGYSVSKRSNRMTISTTIEETII